MNWTEEESWDAFKDVRKFLGNHKDADYEKIFQKMLDKLYILGRNINMKLHFLFFHLDYFSENLGEKLSEEQVNR